MGRVKGGRRDVITVLADERSRKRQQTDQCQAPQAQSKQETVDEREGGQRASITNPENDQHPKRQQPGQEFGPESEEGSP
ncbi:MAG: hypothetical protein BWX81_00608 [Spirochaetes bacterium ADurb.Bin110]|mgnify:CR=1 FL=1|nr:MAG: hypothetical protein BWX81_00608 [Spirochaetes bacterium ADurb.Bin110]